MQKYDNTKHEKNAKTQRNNIHTAHTLKYKRGKLLRNFKLTNNSPLTVIAN